MDESSWRSFLTWSDRHQTKAQELYMLGPEMTAAMVAPAPSQHLFPLARTNRTDSGTDCLLTLFTSLTICSLNVAAFTQSRPLDLALLQNLHQLQCLSLENGGSRGSSQDGGVCCNLNAVQHLTKLVVFAANVSAAAECLFVDKLQSLDIDYGHLIGLHAAGLAACQHLSHLRCMSAVITAQADMDTLTTNMSATHVPNAMSTLSELTLLQMRLDSSPSLAPGHVWNLDWLTHLTNLRKLELSCDCTYTIPSGISQLTKLEDLKLIFNSELPVNPLEVDWPALCKLKQLFLGGWSCCVDHRLQRLTEIRTLSDVHLELGAENLSSYRAQVKALREVFDIHAPWIKLHDHYLLW